MDQQARILAIHKYPGWEPLGADVLEWTERKTWLPPASHGA